MPLSVTAQPPSPLSRTASSSPFCNWAGTSISGTPFTLAGAERWRCGRRATAWAGAIEVSRTKVSSAACSMAPRVTRPGRFCLAPESGSGIKISLMPRRSRRPAAALVPPLALLLLAAGLSASAKEAPRETAKESGRRAELPGREPGGVTLLPNGWRIAPAGRHLAVGDLPLAMVGVPGRPRAGDHQQRLRQAHPHGRRPAAPLRAAEGGRGRRLAGPRLASGRQAALRLGRRQRAPSPSSR